MLIQAEIQDSGHENINPPCGSQGTNGDVILDNNVTRFQGARQDVAILGVKDALHLTDCQIVCYQIKKKAVERYSVTISSDPASSNSRLSSALKCRRMTSSCLVIVKILLRRFRVAGQEFHGDAAKAQAQLDESTHVTSLKE